jgi:hypothetical protein
VFVDAFITGANTDNSVIFDEHFSTGEAGKNIDAALLDLFTKPADKLVQGNDVVSVILQRRRCDRQTELALLR